MTTNKDFLQQLGALGTATLHEAQGQTGAMNHDIKPINPACRLVGRALTVDTRPDDNLMLHYALSKASPGDVIVVNAKGFLEAGLWGDLMTLGALQRGVAGLVIDGAVRDADAIAQMGFAVFCKGLSIKGANKTLAGAINQPIVCGGVAVNSGDIVVGDRDGVVIIPAERAQATLDNALAREQKEDAIRQRLKAGETTVSILGLEDKLQSLGFD